MVTPPVISEAETVRGRVLVVAEMHEFLLIAITTGIFVILVWVVPAGTPVQAVPEPASRNSPIVGQWTRRVLILIQMLVLVMLLVL